MTTLTRLNASQSQVDALKLLVWKGHLNWTGWDAAEAVRFLSNIDKSAPCYLVDKGWPDWSSDDAEQAHFQLKYLLKELDGNA